VKARFRQSSFFCSPIEAETLPLRARDHRPTLNEKGAIESFALQQMDGTRTSEEIAKALLQRYPRHFLRESDAVDYVAELAVRYSQRAVKREASR
jgi:hypothetical protein